MIISDGLKRLAFLLAASDLTEKQLTALFSELRHTSPDVFLRLVRRLRKVNAAVLETELPLGIKRSTRQVTHEKEPTAAQIERLLRVEAGMPIKEAVKLLQESLMRDWILPADALNVPTKLTSEQFRRWLEKVLDYVPASAILHHATSLRNSRVHVDAGDWPLREGPTDDG